MNSEITGLAVFYDPNCGLCRRFREWMGAQSLWVGVTFVGYDTPEAERLFPGIREHGADRECIVLADNHEWWQGGDAWLVCLWATREYRLWSHRLADPAFRPILDKVVHLISSNRLSLSHTLKWHSDREIMEEVAQQSAQEEPCEDGRCTPEQTRNQEVVV